MFDLFNDGQRITLPILVRNSRSSSLNLGICQLVSVRSFPDSKDSSAAQPCSFSCVVDVFLADAVEIDGDCADSAHLSGARGDRPKNNSCFNCEVDAANGFRGKATNILLASPELNNPKARKLLTCEGPTRSAEEYHVAEPSFYVGCEVTTGDFPKDVGEDLVGIGPVSDIKEGSHLNAFSCHTQRLYDALPDSVAKEDHGEGASEGLIMLADTRHHEVNLVILELTI